MASKSEYLKKRKVKTLSDILNRKFDPGKGNPKTVNPNKKKSVVPREPDYFSEAVQKLAYKLGLTDQPSAQAVREEAYKAKPEAKILGLAKAVDKPGGGPEKRQGSSSASMRLRSKIAGRPEYPGSNVRKGGGGGGAGDSGRVGGGLSGSGVTRPSAAATAGTGTSTGAAEKLSAFERLKVRQYEREGYGGRVMTRKRATEQVMKERQYKSPLTGLFKRKGK